MATIPKEVSEKLNAFREAVREGNLVIVDRLLEIPEIFENAAAEEIRYQRGVSRSFEDIFKNAALLIAANWGHLAIVNRLLEVPVVLEEVAVDNNAILRVAAGMGHLLVVNRLLKCSAVLEKIAVRYEYSKRIFFGQEGSFFYEKTINDHGALRAAIGSYHGEKHKIIFCLLQTYLENNISFPDCKVDNKDLISFFNFYAEKIVCGSKALHEHLLPPCVSIVDEYLDNMFSRNKNVAIITPAFDASKVAAKGSVTLSARPSLHKEK